MISLHCSRHSFHIEESIRKMKDAELEAALKEDYGERTDDTEE